MFHDGQALRSPGLSGITSYQIPPLAYVGWRWRGNYIKLEDVTLPARFSALTIHLVMMFALLKNTKALSTQLLHLPVKAPSSAKLSAQEELFKHVAYVGLACFFIEYVTLFAGVSIFRRAVTFWNTIFHLVGAIVLIDWYKQAIPPSDYWAIIVVFSVLPALYELFFWCYLVFFSFKSY